VVSGSEAQVDPRVRGVDVEDGEAAEGAELRDTSLRPAVAVAFPAMAAAIMVGGIFTGATGRIIAVIAAVGGVSLAVVAHRIRRPAAGYAVIVLGLFLIGLATMAPSGLSNLLHVRASIAVATASGSASRPPVPMLPGWQAIIGWILGAAGFLSAWVALSFRKPAMAVMLPLPLAAVAGISVPASAQAPSGVAGLVLFAISLGVLSSGRTFGDERLPLGYELRRAARAVPLIGGVCVLLIVLLQQDFLFPPPAIDPAQEAQRPRTVPLSEVKDRVLFTVASPITGPWRIGSLDVYDGQDWRLPPFAENRLKAVPRSGIVDPSLQGDVAATFTIAGLTGAVLPGLPNTYGIQARGPKLAYDARNGNIRTAEGELTKGAEYTVAAAGVPSASDLDLITTPLPRDIRAFTEIGPAPPAVADLIAKAPTSSKWRQFDYLRSYVLDNVTSAGSGVPKSIDAARVEDMVAGSREGSPFEIVAAQAMLARWIGLPSRIGYGFDGGEAVGDELQVHPRHGATFVEVYFPGYKWLPVIGTPKKAKATTTDAEQKLDPSILPSDDIAIQVFAFQATPPGSVTLARIRQTVAVAVPMLLLIALAYVLWPLAGKALARRRRRRAAEVGGPVAQVALAYSEWRDVAADFGEAHPSDTPFLYLRHFSPDEEHRQLAWLVTRALWGDLRHEVTPELASMAAVLSRSLSRRLRRQQPATLRVVAALSRRSLRAPFDPIATVRPEVDRAA
jgi:hypothetical protein